MSVLSQSGRALLCMERDEKPDPSNESCTNVVREQGSVDPPQTELLGISMGEMSTPRVPLSMTLHGTNAGGLHAHA